MSRIRVGDVLGLVERIAPPGLAEDWDNVGLLLGDPDDGVRGIMVSLDPTSKVLAEAVGAGCNLVISHHPAIFRPLASLRRDRGLGRLYFDAVRAGVSLIACHTNLDSVSGGVNDVLAAGLGLSGAEPLAASALDPAAGMGRIGDLVQPLVPADFLSRLAGVCGCDTVAVCGPAPDSIRRVGLCGGSGSDLAQAARDAGADVFVTGEVKHSVARWAEEEGFFIVDAGHFHTENPVVAELAARLGREMNARAAGVPVLVSRREAAPLRYLHIDGAAD